MVGYKIIPVDLSVARDRTAIVDPGTGVRGLAVRVMPAGASLQAHIGNNGGIDLLGPGDALEICPADSNGIFLTNVAQVGVSVTLLVSFGSLEVTSS